MMKFILIILDGFGLRKEKQGNAVALADTPNLDQMLNECPLAYIETSGKHVGLPDGIMGNSEVGHMNIGAGRIVKQDLVRINEAIKKDELKTNPRLVDIFQFVKKNSSTLHIMGLVGDGGVHSHIDHFDYVLNAAKEYGLDKVVIHGFMDGRDTSPTSGLKFAQQLVSSIKNNKGARVSSICGRYYAMDRDSRWDRIEKAYRMLTHCEGEIFADSQSAIKASYDSGITDEFILPKIIGEPSPMQNGDAVLSMNFRADRMRQITQAINDPDFSHFSVKPIQIQFASMTKYREDFPHPVLFTPEKITKIFPEVLAENNFRQLRIAETEKYAHVTYFFNGGYEQTFTGESRKLIPSPKVATYDLQPEMSAPEVTKGVLSAIESNQFEAIILNYANPDMVGHTGNISAAIKAIETIDTCLGKIRKAVKKKEASIFLTADHGNLEMMTDPETGEVHTAHTILPVPLIMDSPKGDLHLADSGKLADIAPTILDFLQITIPSEMTGNSLLIQSNE